MEELINKWEDPKASFEGVELIEPGHKLSKRDKSLLYPLIKILMEQVLIARELEHYRIKLAQTDDFNLADIYKVFSLSKETTLAKYELI